MLKRIPLLMVAALLLAFTVTAVGCGGDDKDSSSGSGDSSSKSGDSGSKDSGSSDSTPDNVGEAVDQCLEEVEKAGNDQAKEAAKKLCNAAKSGDPEKTRKGARDACLDLAEQIPLADQRKEAEAACRQ